jgi:tetratricopeptide (TPR) repeat protein
MLRKIPAAIAIAGLLLGTIALATFVRDDSPADPRPSAASMRGALVSSTIKSPEEQVAFWRARVDANAGDYLSRTALGHALLSSAKVSGDLDLYPEAEAEFRLALESNPEHPAALLGLGAARGAQHDFLGELALAERVLANDPDDASARLAKADAQFELGDHEPAHETYEQLAQGERSAAISSRLAKTAWLRGDGDEAIRQSEAAIALSSELELPADQAAFYFFQLATFSYRAGEIPLARESVDRALEIDPEHLGALELEPKVSIAEGDLARATEGYEQLLAVSPAADLHGELAKLYTVAGRTEDAQQQVDLGLALGREQVGRYPAERRHLADFFGSFDPVLALQQAEEDITTRQDIGAHDTLAWALHQNGRNAEARDAIQRALDTGVRDAVVFFHAGMIELELGDADAARAWLMMALDINPRFDVLDAPLAEQRLAELA